MIEPELAGKTGHDRSAGAVTRAALGAIAWIFGIVACQAAELSPHDMALLDRLTWGINASGAAHLQAVGAERWLTEQLHPAAAVALPDAVQSQIEAMPDIHRLPFDIAVAFDQQARSANQVADPDNAVAVIAQHLQRFWDQRMRAQIIAHAAQGGVGLVDEARAAVVKLALL